MLIWNDELAVLSNEHSKTMYLDNDCSHSDLPYQGAVRKLLPVRILLGTFRPKNINLQVNKIVLYHTLYSFDRHRQL